MKELMVGNWKMNQSGAEIKEFFDFFDAKFTGKRDAWIAPQAMQFAFVQARGKKHDVKVGLQNCSEHDKGAYTGENSAHYFARHGGNFVIIGHSERRQYFGETSKMCALKIKRCFKEGLTAIYCVGETLPERESNQTLAIVGDQLRQGLSDVTGATVENLIIAYEPVWAIGTGKTASPAQAQEVHAYIRTVLKERYPGLGEKLRILYGGSVKPDNVEELLSQKDIDGGLVGGASLKAKDFLALCGDK
ncbi:MAG: triose-phosphate isomerase [Bacteriovoracaceae bacterium]